MGLVDTDSLMKRLLLIGIVSILLNSCGAAARTTLGGTNSDLIKTVSIEQGCPKENIKILESVRKMGSATYSLDVCGKKMIYKMSGNVFMEASKFDNLFK